MNSDISEVDSMADQGLPGQLSEEGGIQPSEAVVSQPTREQVFKYSSVGLEELAKTDRVLVQQVIY